MGVAHEEAVLEELKSFAEAVAARASHFADDVEVLVIRRDQVSLLIENRGLTPELKLGQLQVGLRALKGGLLASAATTSLSVDENVAALKAALTVGRPAQVGGFSAARIAASTRGFEPGLTRFLREPAPLQELAIAVRDRAFAAASTRPWVESIQGQVVAMQKWQVIATRSGLGAWLENALAISAEVNAAHAEQEVLRSWPADDAFVREVGARAVAAYPRERVSPEQLGLGQAAQVVALLDPNVVEQLFRYPAHDKFLASSLASGNSTLQVGEAIADPRLHLLDTGAPRELAREFDDELVPRRETALIAAGKVGGLVTSRASAKATGLPETGNGARHQLIAEPVNEAPVRDKLLGLCMNAGTRTVAELLGSAPLVIVPRALLGIHGADRARTAFSVTVSDGVAVRDGQVVGQLAPGRWNISGRVLPGDGEPGILGDAEPSRERVYTGSALMPHLRVVLTAG